MNPYDYLLSNASVLLYNVSVILLLGAWVFFSYRKLFRWGVSIKASSNRWENVLLPPDDVTNEIVFFAVVVAANLFLTGLLLHLFA